MMLRVKVTTAVGIIAFYGVGMVVVSSGIGDEARYGLLASSSGSGGRVVDAFTVGGSGC